MRYLLACAVSLLGFVGLSRADDKFVEFKANGADLKIRYVDAGKGEPVILIHGFTAPSAEAMWDKNTFNETKILPLLAKEYRVIAPECRGHGKSSKPHDAKDYGPEMAEDVIRLMDHLKIEKAHIIGYSMGSAIAGKLLVDHPKRLLSVTFGGGAPIVDPPKEFQGMIDELATALEKGEGIGPLVKLLAPAGEKPLTAEEAAALGKLVVLGQDQKALAACIRGLPKLEVTADQLKANKVPVAFLHGTNEAAMLKGQITTATKYLKDAKTSTIEGGDHITTPTKPDFHKAMLDFLHAHPAKPRQ